MTDYTDEELDHMVKFISERPGGWLRHFGKAYLDADEEGKTIMRPALYWFIQRYEIDQWVYGGEYMGTPIYSMREFKIKLSDEDVQRLIDNSYLIEQEPDKGHTIVDVLRHELDSIMELDGSFGATLGLPSLEVKEEDR